MKLTRAEAKKWCIKKWEWLVENPKQDFENRDLIKVIPELGSFWCACAYCELFGFGANESCMNCPLYNLWGKRCAEEGSPWYKWRYSRTLKTRKKYAQIILDDIRKT